MSCSMTRQRPANNTGCSSLRQQLLCHSMPCINAYGTSLFTLRYLTMLPRVHMQTPPLFFRRMHGQGMITQ